MAKIDVEGQLKARFAQPLAPAAARRIVIWSDPAGEFEDAFDGLAERGFDGAGATDAVMPAGEGFVRPVRFVEAAEGGMFEVKRLISRGDVVSDMLVYRQRARGDIEGDWLADVELYADHFQADFLSLLADELNAEDSTDVRAALETMRAFFAAKDRVRRFSKCCPAPASGADVELGVLAALLDGASADDATGGFVVRGYLRELLHNGGPAAFEAFAKYGAGDALARWVQRITGFSGALDGATTFAELASHVLLSAASLSIPAAALAGLEGRISLQNAQYCLAVVKDWDRDARFSSEDLFEVCRRVEDECGLAARFAAAPLADIVECDVFPCINEAILATLFESFAQGADREADARTAVDRRCNLAWHARVACYFEALEAIADMHGFKAAHAQGFHEAQAARVWQAYTQDWWRMDALYRKLCRAAGACRTRGYENLEEPLRAAMQWAEGLYSNWFLADAVGRSPAAAMVSWLGRPRATSGLEGAAVVPGFRENHGGHHLRRAALRSGARGCPHA